MFPPSFTALRQDFSATARLHIRALFPYFSAMTDGTVLTLDLPGIPKLKSGKVREIFDLGDAFLFVASDRISAFDCVMPNGIPRKGEVLTQLSHFWFDQVANIVPNHRMAQGNDPLPVKLKPFEKQI